VRGSSEVWGGGEWGVWVALVYRRLSREGGGEGTAPRGARSDVMVMHVCTEWPEIERG
jgi:hypothetical protein